MPHTQPKLLDQLRAQLRLRHYSYRTEQTYVLWVKQVIWFHDCKHPLHMGKAEIEAFLTHLAVNRRVAASTQNLALSAAGLSFAAPWIACNSPRTIRTQRGPLPSSGSSAPSSLGRCSITSSLRGGDCSTTLM